MFVHFGSREQLVSSALSAILGRIQRSFLEMLGTGSLDRALLTFWRSATGEVNARYRRLLFEVHGLAVHDPETYGAYPRDAFESWKALLTERVDKRLRGNSKSTFSLLLVTLPVMILVGLALLRPYKAPQERAVAAIALVAPGMLLDTVSSAGFPPSSRTSVSTPPARSEAGCCSATSSCYSRRWWCGAREAQQRTKFENGALGVGPRPTLRCRNDHPDG